MSSNESMIFNLYGALFEAGQHGFSLRTLCAMLGSMGFSAEASRLALSRMARRGLLYTRRSGKASFYFLSDSALAVIRTAESRSVFRGQPAAWDGKLRLVSYELPETLRHERIALADTLRCAGFGRAAAGLWVSAYDPDDSVRAYLGRPEIAGYVEEYAASHAGDTRAFAWRVWRLAERRDSLGAFSARYAADRDEFLARQASGIPPKPADCFSRYFGVLSDFVKTMASMPPVPAELLPDDWPAASARELFVSYRALVHDGAEAFFESVYEPFELKGRNTDA